MQMLRVSVSALIALAILVQFPAQSAGATRHVALNRADRALGQHVAQRAGTNMAAAAAWAARQHRVRSVARGRYGQGMQIQFRDGAQLDILSSTISVRPLRLHSSARVFGDVAAGSAGRAAVLLPFQDELHEGPDAASVEISTLKAAGFTVDVYRNTDVTVSLMQHLNQYSVVYIETHSYVSKDGSVAVIVTGDTHPEPSAAFFKDGTVQQAFVAGDPEHTLYVGFNTGFVRKHMDNFPDSSIVFLNGCDVLRATDFWSALQTHNVGTLVSWDHEVYSTINEFAADYLFPQLGNGQSISTAIGATTAAGLGQSTVDGIVAHLGYLGDGDNTLLHALAGATATPTATASSSNTATPEPSDTPVATDTSTATPLPVKHKHCKKGLKRVKRHGKYRCVKVKKKP